MISIFKPFEFFRRCHFGSGELDAGDMVVLVMSVMTVVVVMGLRLVTVVILVIVVMIVMGVKLLVVRVALLGGDFCVVEVEVEVAGFDLEVEVEVGVEVGAARTSGCQGGKKREIFFLEEEGEGG